MVLWCSLAGSRAHMICGCEEQSWARTPVLTTPAQQPSQLASCPSQGKWRFGRTRAGERLEDGSMVQDTAWREREIAKAAPLSNCLFASQATGAIFILNQDIWPNRLRGAGAPDSEVKILWPGAWQPRLAKLWVEKNKIFNFSRKIFGYHRCWGK